MNIKKQQNDTKTNKQTNTRTTKYNYHKKNKTKETTKQARYKKERITINQKQ